MQNTEFDDCTDNCVEALLDTLLATLAKCSRSSNSNVGYSPSSTIEIPFSKDVFWKVFKEYVPKNIDECQSSVKFRLTIDKMNKALGTDCDKYMKPNSTTQIRIFGFYEIHFYEYIQSSKKDDEKLLKRYYLCEMSLMCLF